MPFSAAAPAIFSTTSVPATPRRPVVNSESSTATSSLVTTCRIWPSDISAAHVEVHHIALVILDDEQATGAGVDSGCAAASIWSGVGEVNTWPGQAASSMP